jgi:hypothetical protein
MSGVTRRAWLILVVAVIVIGAAVGLVLALGGGGSPAPKKSPIAKSPSSAAAPRLPSICPALPQHLVAGQLHLPISKAVPASTRFIRTCRWRDRAGDVVLTLTTDTQPDFLLLHTLGSNGAAKIKDIGAQAIFAPRPPRLALNVKRTGVLIRVEAAGYRPLLPTGTTDPGRIPRAQVLGPLTAFGKAAVRYLTR